MSTPATAPRAGAAPSHGGVAPGLREGRGHGGDGRGRGGGGHGAVSRQDRVLILFCGFAAGMLLLDLHKVSIAIPSIDAALNPGPVRIQLIAAAYVICFAVTLVPAGRLGDHGWRRQLAVGGLYGYLLSSVVCAVAPNAETVIAGRALLGVSAGLLMPQVMGIVQQRFTGGDRARAFGVYGICVSVATALGPSIGGLFLLPELFGWRGVFAMNIPVGVGLIVAAHILLRPGMQPRPARRLPELDGTGVLLVSAALLGFLAPVIFTTGRPSDAGQRWLLLLPATAAAVLFVVRSRQRRRLGHATLINPELLTLPSFRNGVLISLTWFASGPGFALALVIYLQQAEGLTPFGAGLVMLPAAVASAAGAWIGGRLVMTWGRRLTLLGMVLAVVAMTSTLLLLRSGPAGSEVLLGVALLQVVLGLGAGMVVSPNHTQMLADVPAAEGSSASSIGQLGQRIANSFGVAAASVAYFATTYGQGWTLSNAPPDLHLTAATRTVGVAGAFLLAALVVGVMDLRRQRATPGAGGSGPRAEATALAERVPAGRLVTGRVRAER